MEKSGEYFPIPYPHDPIDNECDEIMVLEIEDPAHPVPGDSFVLELLIASGQLTSAVQLHGQGRWLKLTSDGRYRCVQGDDDQILNADISDYPSPDPPRRRILSTQPIAIPPDAVWTGSEDDVPVFVLTFHEYAPDPPDLEHVGSEIRNPKTSDMVYHVMAPKGSDLKGCRVRVVWQRKPVRIDNARNL